MKYKKYDTVITTEGLMSYVMGNSNIMEIMRKDKWNPFVTLVYRIIPSPKREDIINLNGIIPRAVGKSIDAKEYSIREGILKNLDL